MKKNYQYIVMGNFLAWDKQQNCQKKICTMLEFATTYTEADQALGTQWKHLKNQKHEDLRFFGVIYKAETVRIFA